MITESKHGFVKLGDWVYNMASMSDMRGHLHCGRHAVKPTKHPVKELPSASNLL